VVLTSDVTVIAEPGGAAQMIVNGETLTGTWKGSDDASGNVILALTAPNGDKANGGIVQGGKDSTFVMSFGGRCANSIGPMTRSTVAAPTTAAATLAPGTAPTPAAGGAVAPASANTGSSSTGLLVGGGAAVIVLAGAGTFVVLRRRERTAAEVASSRPGKS
jgi:LPXTG-motif cell wall-anchored protein